MCGICGVVTNPASEPADPHVVVRMCQAMRHRGPDGQGFFHRPDVHLGHVRLSIIDVATGQQPMANEDGRIHVVFNGEIYNYRDLRGPLEARGHVFRTHSDTEVLVHLYEEYGREMVQYLIGEFAFAIWDDNLHRLFVARDRLGVKPVFYAQLGARFLFASELTALMSSGCVPRRIDESVIRPYLLNRTIPAPRTIYLDVQKLLPGHWLDVRDGRVQDFCYWDLEFHADESRSEADFAEELRHLIDDSVRRQLMSEVPLGAFLSGGVDSTTVVTSMVRYSSTPVKTFSIGVRERGFDESPYYTLVARRLGVEHHEFVFEPDLIKTIPSLVYHFGEPCAIGSALPLYCLCQLARQHVTVALSGDGADEVFAGYNVYNYAHWLQILDSWAGPPLASAWPGRLLDNLRVSSASRFGNIIRRLRKINRLVALPASHRMAMMGNLDALGRSLLATPRGPLVDPVYEAAFDRAARAGDWLTPYLYADIKTLLPDEMFTKLDRMSMAHSLEGRVPLVDYRLVELAARIPARMKLKRGQVKAILKQAMRERLPIEVLRRRKVGFRVPFSDWFRGPLRAMVLDHLTSASFRQCGFFDHAAVGRLLERHMSGLDQHGNEILALLKFDMWRRELHETAYAPQSAAVA